MSKLAGGEESAEPLLEAVLANAVDGVIVIDTQGTIELVNRAVETIFGYSAEELVGQNVKMLMPPSYSEAHDGYLSSYLRTGETRVIGVGREVEGRRRDGSVFPLDLAVSEVNLPGRRRFAGQVRDVSVQRKLEEEARVRLTEVAHGARLLELGEMVSGIAHEVNQPLTAIVTFAAAASRLLEKEEPDLEQLNGALTQIMAQGERAAKVIKGLRELTRKHESNTEPVSLGVLVADVLALLQHEIERRRVTVDVSLSPDLVPFPASKVQIEQVLLNLLRNAIEAVSECAEHRRKVTVRAETTAAETVVCVSDLGVGIADAERLFDTFYTTKPDGVGVGLNISRSIIEAHGGTLKALTVSGEGACFQFTVPNGRSA